MGITGLDADVIDTHVVVVEKARTVSSGCGLAWSAASGVFDNKHALGKHITQKCGAVLVSWLHAACVRQPDAPVQLLW